MFQLLYMFGKMKDDDVIQLLSYTSSKSVLISIVEDLYKQITYK